MNSIYKMTMCINRCVGWASISTDRGGGHIQAVLDGHRSPLEVMGDIQAVLDGHRSLLRSDGGTYRQYWMGIVRYLEVMGEHTGSVGWASIAT